ncbi:MAG: hypothetical protein KBD78_12515 [Oligoflexales bacterium]|nr:hypothetical protein [Oligoflexales bacterium]
MNKNRLSYKKKRLRKRLYYGLIGACLLFILVFLVSLQLAEFKALSGDELKSFQVFNTKISDCEFQSPPQALAPNWLHYNSYLYMLMLESSCLPDGLDTRFLGKWNLWIYITGLFALGCLIRLILRSWLSALVVVCMSIATIYFKSEIGLISPFHSSQSLAIVSFLFLLLYQLSGSIFIQLSYQLSMTALLLFDASFLSWIVLLPLVILFSGNRNSLGGESTRSDRAFANAATLENFSIFSLLKKMELRIQAYPIFLKNSRELQQRLNGKKSNILMMLAFGLQFVLITYLLFFANQTMGIFTKHVERTFSLDVIIKFVENWFHSLIVSTTTSTFVVWLAVFCLHLIFLLLRRRESERLELFLKMLLIGFWLHFASRFCLDFLNIQTPNFSQSKYRETIVLFAPLLLIAAAAYVYNCIESRFIPRFQKAREIEFV